MSGSDLDPEPDRRSLRRGEGGAGPVAFVEIPQTLNRIVSEEVVVPRKPIRCAPPRPLDGQLRRAALRGAPSSGSCVAESGAAGYWACPARSFAAASSLSDAQAHRSGSPSEPAIKPTNAGSSALNFQSAASRSIER